VLDFAGTPLTERRISNCKDLHEKLFSLMMLGDDRAISATYVLGELAHKKD
jgi:guanine deaminase